MEKFVFYIVLLSCWCCQHPAAVGSTAILQLPAANKNHQFWFTLHINWNKKYQTVRKIFVAIRLIKFFHTLFFFVTFQESIGKHCEFCLLIHKSVSRLHHSDCNQSLHIFQPLSSDLTGLPFCPPFASVNVSICFAYWDWLALIQYVCGWWQQWKNILSFQLGRKFCHCLFKIWPLWIFLLPKLTAVHLTNITKFRTALEMYKQLVQAAEADEMCQHVRNSLLMWSALPTFLWKGLRMENLLVWIIWWVLLGAINSALKVLEHAIWPCTTLVLWNIAILRTFGVYVVNE